MIRFGEYIKQIMFDISKKYDFEILEMEVDKDHIHIMMFFASTFWRKMQNIFGECCISKLKKVARPRLAAILPAT